MRRRVVGLNGIRPRWVTNTNGVGKRRSARCWWRIALDCGHEVERARETPPRGVSYDCPKCEPTASAP